MRGDLRGQRAQPAQTQPCLARTRHAPTEPCTRHCARPALRPAPPRPPAGVGALRAARRILNPESLERDGGGNPVPGEGLNK